MKKEELRSLMKAKRRNLSEAERTDLSEMIFKKLSELREYKNAKTVCVYMSSFGEVETDLIIADAREKGKKLLFPVTDIKSNTLSLCYDTGEFNKGAYGILEPYPKREADFNTPDIVIIPALAFDEEKNRLGFGGGYYDRLLAKTNAFKIGICYDFQIVKKIEAENHDIKMDMIITDKS